MKSRSPDSFLVKATLLLASTLTVMAGATIAPSLPVMRQHFGAVPNADYWVRLVLTVPALFIAIGAPIAGTIIDRFGRKSLLGLAVLLYGLAGSSGFLLNAIGPILVGRMLLGFSVATLATSISALSYQRLKARVTFTNIYAIAFGLIGIGYLVISFVRSYELVLVGLTIGGLGVGLLMPNMNVCLTSSTPTALRGRILGGLTTRFFLGQFVSPLVSQLLSQWAGLGTTYGLAGGLMLVMTAITVGVMVRWK